MRSLLALLVCQGAAAFSAPPGVVASRSSAAPATVCMAAESAPTRRAALASFAAAALLPAMPAFAADDMAGYKLKKDYPTDARQMLNNMVVATDMARGTPDMEKIVKATRSEMNDFVAFYRRQPKVAGMPSFSTMYTAINTLSGHYASYGNKYPVPEKRRVRLKQQVRSAGSHDPAIERAACVSSAPFLVSPGIGWLLVVRQYKEIERALARGK
jgi:photosystem II Psb27 protein